MKTSSLLIVVSLSAALAACGGSESPAAAPAEPAADAQAGAAPVADESLPRSDFMADAAQPPSAGGGCALDAVDGVAVGDSAAIAGQAVMEGWAVPADPAAMGDAMLVLSGAGASYTANLTRSLERPDVAASLQREDAATSGFKQRVSLASVAEGEYAVHVRVGGVQCDTGRKVVVAG
jgi:hypothetical protein